MGTSSTAFSSKVWLNMMDPAALYSTPKQAWQASRHVWRSPPHCEGTVDLFITVRTLFLGSFVLLYPGPSLEIHNAHIQQWHLQKKGDFCVLGKMTAPCISTSIQSGFLYSLICFASLLMHRKLCVTGKFLFSLLPRNVNWSKVRCGTQLPTQE